MFRLRIPGAFLLLLVIAPTSWAADVQKQAVPGQKVRVAGVVLKWLRGDKEANYRRAEPLIREAAADGAQIVCTTECFLDGYAIADKSIPLDQYRALGEPIPDGQYFRKLAGLAKELKIYLVAGMLEADGEARYNTAALIGPDGDARRQVPQATARTRGRAQHRRRRIDGVRDAAWQDRRDDLRRPPFPRRGEGLSGPGAAFLLCPSGGMFGPKSNDPILQARSKENRMHIIFVHPAEFLVTGPDGAILERTSLGKKLVITRDEVGTDADSKKVSSTSICPCSRPLRENPPHEDANLDGEARRRSDQSTRAWTSSRPAPANTWPATT